MVMRELEKIKQNTIKADNHALARRFRGSVYAAMHYDTPVEGNPGGRFNRMMPTTFIR
jgi:hypothetical protein